MLGKLAQDGYLWSRRRRGGCRRGQHSAANRVGTPGISRRHREMLARKERGRSRGRRRRLPRRAQADELLRSAGSIRSSASSAGGDIACRGAGFQPSVGQLPACRDLDERQAEAPTENGCTENGPRRANTRSLSAPPGQSPETRPRLRITPAALRLPQDFRGLRPGLARSALFRHARQARHQAIEEVLRGLASWLPTGRELIWSHMTRRIWP